MHTAKNPPSRYRLTDRFTKSVKPDRTRRLYWDITQQGLVLSVEPTGHKSFKLIYTLHGRARWYTIGSATKIGLKEAREIARKRMGEVYSGVDIQAERQTARQAGTFEQLAHGYIEKHAKRRNKSWRQAANLVRTYLLPRWRNIQASAIARSDARLVFDRLTQEGSPVLANQVLAATSAIFSWAIKHEVGNVAINPCSGIERNATMSRERVLSDRELPLFWRAFEGADFIRCSALRMLLLTGQRPGEVRHMRREHIEDKWWTMPGEPTNGWPGTKNGQSHRVWLSKPAREILNEVSNEDGPGFIFRGARDGPVTALDKAMRVICQNLRVNKNVTPHDLRRTHGTTVTSLGFTRDQMNRLQNHKEGGIGSVYDRHSYADENRRIQEAVAAKILSQVKCNCTQDTASTET